LDCPHSLIREESLRAILARRSPAGHREIIRRLHTVDDRWKEIIAENRGRMTSSLRDAVLSSDRQMCVNGCLAAVWFREYDLLPAIVNAVEDQANPNGDLASQTLLDLAEALYSELAGHRDYRDRRDPQLIRKHVISTLELSAQRYGRHRRRAVIEAFLLLVNRDNVTLKQILQDPHHAAFVMLVDVLSKSPRNGVFRLLLGFLDDPHAPSAALSILSKRCDVKFVRYLVRKIGWEPSAVVVRNLKRIGSIGWLQSGNTFLDELDDTGQHSAVKLMMTSGMPRLRVLEVIEYLLSRGKPGGRRAAAEALSEFQGAEANAVALRALDDEDPQVQANVLVQMRRRGIPGVLPRLVRMIDSPHAVVRQAVQKSLAEFSFRRFLRTFDILDEEVRRSTGLLVKKIDPQTIPLLQAEMESPVRTRRFRALAIARDTDSVGQLEATVVTLLHNDENHLVRAEAAVSLVQCSSATSQEALDQALADRSLAVREAARQSLARREQFNRWRESLSDPRD